MNKVITTMAMVALLTGCATFNKIAVTLTAAEDVVMKEWAALHNDKKTSPELDVQVMTAHAKFKESCELAAVYLAAYNAGGSQSAYVQALEAARATIGPLIQMIQPMLSEKKVESLKSLTAKATKL